MKIIIEVFAFLLKTKKFWLIPIVLILIIFGSIFILAQGTVFAPFIYTLF